MENGKRIHSLDALRAIMMILGIVLHSSETYAPGVDLIWPKDPNAQHVFQTYLSSLIHIFRMPIFFFIAGFFGSMLYYERSPSLMIRNRISRILLPFLVFLFLLHPLILLAYEYTSSIFGVTLPNKPPFTPYPIITYHLWFLYYLILITAITIVLAKALHRLPQLTNRIVRYYEWLINNRLMFFVLFSSIIFLMLVWMWNYWAPTPLGFKPDGKVLLFYLLFYLLGWVQFKTRHLLDRFKKYDWLFTILGTTIFTVKFIFHEYIGDILYGGLNAIIIWFLLFGITGLFIRYFSDFSERMRYISDSSYWVYLIHLPITVLVPGFIAGLWVHAIAKFMIVAIITSIVCFTSYHYLVRNSFIGKFLNGRRYPLKSAKPDAAY